ncbi:hypothetical protein [Streptomyces violascens]|uniref:hypothetical protein n=1 Tax=Streptomyces violascens TaxID=67381 RepID=UPI0036576BCB
MQAALEFLAPEGKLHTVRGPQQPPGVVRAGLLGESGVRSFVAVLQFAPRVVDDLVGRVRELLEYQLFDGGWR